MPLNTNPCPKDHEIYNFGRPFLGPHYYTPSLSDLYLGEEENNACSLYSLYCQVLAQEPLPQRSEIYNFGRSFLEIFNSGRPFLSHHKYALSLS